MRGIVGVGLVLALATVPAGAQGEFRPEARTADALRKAAFAAIDSGEFAPAAARTRFYARAAALADSAVRLAPNDPEVRITKAIAAGRAALAESPRERVKYAVVVREEALATLRLKPAHAGAHHVLGMWHAEVMRLNRLARFAARAFLGASVFGEANWDEARRELERAVELEPERITHRLDLAGVLADRGDRAGARAQYEWILRAPPRDFNDPAYKRLAAQRLERL